METRLLETGNLKAVPLHDLIADIDDVTVDLYHREDHPEELADSALDMAIHAMKIYVASKHDGWF
jgi:hypothetical protein